MLLLDALKKFVELLSGIATGLLHLKAIRMKRRKSLAGDLSPYFTGQDVFRATRYFIPTRFQESVPIDKEIGDQKPASDRKLVPHLLKLFENDLDGKKYYMVLGDIGLGKTTFLINLYLKARNKTIYLPDDSLLYNIKVLPLGDSRTFKEIEKIEEKRTTILLLDAFDEDILAVKNYKSRLIELINKTENFKKVVVTCRTQFFPSEVEEPDRTGIWSFGEGGEYRFQKIYLDYFNDWDIRTYLRKRFPFFSSFSSLEKRRRAKKVIEKCPLMMWPFLLSHIEDFLNFNYDFQSYQLYEVLIEKWILRESAKKGIREKYVTEENYKVLLYRFCQNLAVDLYEKSNERGGYFIHKDEKIINSDLQLSDLNDTFMSEIDAKSRSLLNRSADGKYKFVHKSVLEYFLSKELNDNSEFLIDFDFNSMNLAKRFYDEKFIDLLRKCGGRCSYVFPEKKFPDNDETFFPISGLSRREVNDVKVMIFTSADAINPLHFINLRHLRELVIIDEENLFPVYLYYALRTNKVIGSPSKEQKFREIFDEFITSTSKELLKSINRAEMLDILRIRNQVFTIETKFILERLDKMNYFERICTLGVRDKLDLLGKLQMNAIIDAESEELKSYFDPVNSFFEKAALLRKKLPHCVIRH